jgi:hypothetical protein
MTLDFNGDGKVDTLDIGEFKLLRSRYHSDGWVYQWTGEKWEVPADSVTDSMAKSGFAIRDFVSSSVDNKTTYSNSDPLLNDLGGIKASEHKNGFNDIPITDLITELLYPYTKPVINSFTLNPAAGAKEKNVSLSVTSATAKVTKKSKPIASVSLYKGDTLVETKTDEISSSGTTLTFAVNETLDGTTNTSYTLKVVEAGDNANTVTSSTQTYSFVYPYFYGTVANGTDITSDVVLSLSKEVRAKASHSHSFTTNNTCPVIAYPKSYGVLKSIVDPNNFTQTWPSYTVTVNNDTDEKAGTI